VQSTEKTLFSLNVPEGSYEPLFEMQMLYFSAFYETNLFRYHQQPVL